MAGTSRGNLGFLPSWLRRDWLVGLLLIAATVLAYQRVWHAGFIWDDDSFLTQNATIKSADGLYRMWISAATPDYYPVTYGMMWLEWRLWGGHALGYHLVNVLLHGVSAALLWRVLLRLGIPGAPLAAALFALHPVNVESVAWITSRKNTLCMVFYLATLLAWLKFEDSGKRQWQGLSVAGFALALLSKTAVGPLPMVLLGIAWWRRGRVTWQDARRVVPFFLMAAVLGLVTLWFQSKACGHDPVRPEGFWSRLAGAGWAVWFYLYKAVWPLRLAFIYPRWRIDERSVLSYVPLALLAAAFAVFWHWRRGWGKPVLFCLGYFVLMLLPVLGFINIYFMRFSLVADHWQYFAIIGPLALAGAVLKRPAVGWAVLLALGALTWKQCGMYANSEVLWQTVNRAEPGCWQAEDGLGDIAFQAGRLEEAIAHYQRAVELNPGFGEGCHSLGNVLQKQGRLAEAVAQYQMAAAFKSNYAEAYFDLGRAYSQMGRVDDAIAQFQRVAQITPDFPPAREQLGIALLQRGRVEEAIAQLQRAVQLKPDYAQAHNHLGAALLKLGRAGEAIAQFGEASRIDPAEPAFQANLAWVLATCPEASLRNGQKAEELARRANTLSGGNNPRVLQTLAAALAETGRYGEAAAAAQSALQLAERQSNTNLVRQLQSQEELYQAGSPFRSPEPAH